MSKFFSTKLFLVKKMDGNVKMFRNRDDASEFCDENLLDFKSCVDVFDSKKEYERFLKLKEQQENGEISELKRQVEYELIPPYYEERVVGSKRKKSYMVNGLVFGKKAEAASYCKEKSISKKEIEIAEVTELVKKRVCVEQSAAYTADFSYRLQSGELVVEDVKSPYTRKEQDYILRRKLMLHVHGIKIKEIVL